jgi:hypothetical protein
LNITPQGHDAIDLPFMFREGKADHWRGCYAPEADNLRKAGFEVLKFNAVQFMVHPNLAKALQREAAPTLEEVEAEEIEIRKETQDKEADLFVKGTGCERAPLGISPVESARRQMGMKKPTRRES